MELVMQPGDDICTNRELCSGDGLNSVVVMRMKVPGQAVGTANHDVPVSCVMHVCCNACCTTTSVLHT